MNPFNQIEYENKFIDKCQLSMKTSVKISYAIYSHFEYNSSDYPLFSDADIDINFDIEDNLFV